MFFSVSNIWLWVSVTLAAAVLFADIYGALAGGAAARLVTLIAIPLHILLLASLLLGGAELVLAVTCMTVSLLAYTSARAIKFEVEKRREEENDL